MVEDWILASICCFFAAVPIMRRPRMFLTNPASYVLLAVAWSIVLKLLYIGTLHSEPQNYPMDPIDPVFVDNESLEFLTAGLYALAAALGSYCFGYFLLGRRERGHGESPVGEVQDRGVLLVVLTVALVGTLAAFVAYLVMSGNNPFVGPVSAKRFLPADIGVSSRFAYPPFYAFKLATLAFQLTLVALVGAFARRGGTDRRLVQFSLLAFGVTLFIAHFANMRLVTIVLVVQFVLLGVVFSRKLPVLLLSVVVGLGLVTMFSVTYVHRNLSPFQSAEWGVAKAAEGSADLRQGEPASTPKLSHRFLYKTFKGRYLLDVVKMGHVVEAFPETLPFLNGVSFVNMPLWPIQRPEAAVGLRAVGIGVWLGQNLFYAGDPTNRGTGVSPGLAVELFVNFGHSGLVVGFFLLGVVHRRMFEVLLDSRTGVLRKACVIVVIPYATLVLLNTGFLAAVTRTVIDLGAIVTIMFLANRIADSRVTGRRLGSHS